MEMLHKELLANHSWYKEWHELKGATALSWGILLMVATVYTNTVLFVIGG